MSSYPRRPIKRCQEEDFFQRWNGEELVFSKAEDGLTMKSTNQNLSSFSSDVLKELTPEQASHQSNGLPPYEKNVIYLY